MSMSAEQVFASFTAQFGAEVVEQQRADYGDEAAKKTLNKYRRAAIRQREQQRRREARAGNVELYSGPVTLAVDLRALICEGKRVKSSMHNHPLTRATSVTPLYLGDRMEQRGELVVLLDGRAHLGTGILMAEIIDTGTDIRVHLCRRSSPLPETRAVPVLSLSAPVDAPVTADEFLSMAPPDGARRRPYAPIMPPLGPPQGHKISA